MINWQISCFVFFIGSIIDVLMVVIQCFKFGGGVVGNVDWVEMIRNWFMEINFVILLGLFYFVLCFICLIECYVGVRVIIDERCMEGFIFFIESINIFLLNSCLFGGVQVRSDLGLNIFNDGEFFIF